MKNDELTKEFERELPLPESLSKNNMVKMLKEHGTMPEKKKIKIFPKALSAAAVFIIVIVAAMSIEFRSEFIDVEPTAQPSASEIVSKDTPYRNGNEETTYEADIKEEAFISNLKVPKSEKDLRNHFLKLYTENKFDDCIDSAFDVFVYGVMEDAAIMREESTDVELKAESNMSPTQAPAAQSSANGSADKIPHGTTNTQVADVDEGDIIKNDGEYLYIVNNGSTGTKITIVNIRDMKTVCTKSVSTNEKNEPMYINDIYVNGNILIALCTDDSKTYSVVYDITRKFAPEKIRTVDQDGQYVSSRMVDGVLYTVTNYSVRGSSAKEIEENAIPKVNCDCIDINKCYIFDEDSTEYVILSAFDTTEKNSDVSSVSLLGNGFEIYSSAKNLYVYAEEYDDKYDGTFTATTNIYSFSINGTDIEHKATGSVKGSCINQYSFDEYEGNLRVAACYYDYKTNKDVSCVYVLNEKLEKIGEVFDLAEDEQVKAVRFMGKTGYVVTFRNTDPLFIIDFSDPTAPAITGELKIPGFSTYIHPLGEDYLVGIGYDGTEENADFDKVKVSVFDVSDKTNPVETDTFIVKDAYSQVNDNPKAFLYYPEKNMIGLPVTHYDGKGNDTKGIQTLIIENGKITSHTGFVHNTSEKEKALISRAFIDDITYSYAYYTIFRGTYVGDFLYTIDNTLVLEHNLVTGETTRACTLINNEDKVKSSDIIQENTTDKTSALTHTTTTASPQS